MPPTNQIKISKAIVIKSKNLVFLYHHLFCHDVSTVPISKIIVAAIDAIILAIAILNGVCCNILIFICFAIQTTTTGLVFHTNLFNCCISNLNTT